MAMYNVSYTILGNTFKISTTSRELIEKQIQHISQFCYSNPCFDRNNESNSILIEYFEDESIFSLYKQLFITSKYQTICTFEKEYHAKVNINSEIYFMQLPDKYIVRKKSNKHYILIGNQKYDTTKYVFRLIREIIVRIQENNGKMFMHGTSLVMNGMGISILGNVSSGKTSYFSKLLSVGNCLIISNDRTFFYLDKTDEKIKMDYFPIPIVYKIGSVKNNSFLKKNILESKKYMLPQSFKDGITSYPIPLTDVPTFFPNTNFQQTSNLNMVIFSKIDFNRPFVFESKVLSKEKCISTMLENCFTPIDTESYRSPWAYPRYKSDFQLKSDSIKIINKIVDSIPIYFITFGKDICNEELYFKTKQLMEGIS